MRISLSLHRAQSFTKSGLHCIRSPLHTALRNVPVKMEQMRRCVCHPYLGFPCDFAKVSAHDGGAVWKSCYIDKSSRRSGK